MKHIGWSTFPSDMTVRVGDAMVHRVCELVGSRVHGDAAILECGARVPVREMTDTKDPVDCMACMVRRTTTAMEAEWVENGLIELYDVPNPKVTP